MTDPKGPGSDMPELPEPAIGDYVLATKYTDGDPGDSWALGIYDGDTQGRHYVKDSAGNQIRGNGFRKVARIRKDVGRWLLTVAAPHLERCPPGTVNLWTMLTPQAFDLERDRDGNSAPRASFYAAGVKAGMERAAGVPVNMIEQAQGWADIAALQHNITPDFWRKGDAVLCWVNEGALGMATMGAPGAAIRKESSNG